MIFDFTVNDDKIILTGNSGAVTGSVNFYNCRFTFSKSWRDLEKFAVFTRDGKTYTALIVNNVCPVPQEVLESNGVIEVGVYGSSLDKSAPLRISTDLWHIVIKDGSYRSGSEPQTPAPELWEQYFQRVAETAADSLTERFGNMDKALDTIIAIQERLIGGELA